MVTEYGGVVSKIQLEVRQVSCFYPDSVSYMGCMFTRNIM
jgi:hypothetical protein